MARKGRFCRLGKKAGGRLVKAGAVPAFSYGANTYGTTSTTFKKVRGFACSVKGELRGRSTFARLRLENYDPAAGMAIGPIVEWAKAIWDGVVSKGDIQIVWQQAHSTMAGRAMPFRNFKGPGGATLASCMRIGWKFPSPTKVIKKDGSWLEMQSVCPMQIRLHALSDLSSIEAESSSLASRIGGPPNLEPLCDYVATKTMRESPAAGSLRALGEGGWWTQDRLFAEGRADDQWCKACGDRGTLGPAVGSLHHRTCACSATKELRDSLKGQAIMAKA